MVLHNHISAPLGHRLTASWLDLSPGTIYWNPAELGWAKSSWATFAALNAGATLFVHDDRRPFSASNILSVLDAFDVSHICFAPTVYRHLLASLASHQGQRHFKALRKCCTAGEALGPEVQQRWKQLTGLDIFEGYGQTETVVLCFQPGPCSPHQGSMGVASPGLTLAILSDKAEPVAANVEGHIGLLVADGQTAMCPWIFDGYLKPNGTIERPTMRSADGKHWYLTGDRGQVDKHGNFWFAGRADDVISSSAYRIGPGEVEAVLQAHPAVLESAVVGSPDPVRGEIVKAFIILRESHKSKDRDQLGKDIIDFVASRSAPYKKPREVEFVDSLPKTSGCL